MVNVRKIGLTLAQISVGCCCGVLAGVISLYLVSLAWRGLNQVHLGGFLTAILLVISFLIVYAAVVTTTAEGVRQMGRFIPKQVSRRRIYEGSFLGLCAAVAILSVTLASWTVALDEQLPLIRVLGNVFYYVIVIPLKLFIFWLPPLLILIIAAPIGAAIAYNVPPSEEATESEGTEEKSRNSKSGEKRQ
jgi:hypothetical protein